MINSFRGKYRFLSNFYPCKVTYEGVEYRSTEHAYQAAKTLNPIERMMVETLLTPTQAKAWGQRVAIREDWENVRLGVMQELINRKFDNPELGKLLLRTDNNYLIEGNNWHDNFWGSCVCPKCGDNGENHLGQLLMRKRNKLAIDARIQLTKDVSFMLNLISIHHVPIAATEQRLKEIKERYVN